MKVPIIVFALFLLVACSDYKNSVLSDIPDDNVPLIEQGVYGEVKFWKGNFMPSPDGHNPSGIILPVSRKLYVFEKTRLTDVSFHYGPFISEIRTQLITIIASDNNGKYFVSLPPGEYSIFVRENDQFYANMFHSDYIAPFLVEADRWTNYDIQITYLAYF